MASMLKQVLQIFEQHKGPISLGRMARELDLEPAILEGMIDYWVRKGRLRASGGPAEAAACPSCSIKSGCPMVMVMPRTYELVLMERNERPPAPAVPPCCQD